MPPSRNDAEAWLDSLAGIGWSPGLDRIDALCEALGRPQDRFRSIHVVGTNGKTSTTRYAASILTARGITNGSMTSPHFESWSERVRIDDRKVDPSIWSEAVVRVRATVPEVERSLPESGPVSQFEASVAAELLAMADSGVEVGVVEAGMGGRLDATNVISAEVVVLTSIGLDHTEWLGSTEAAIAAEKLAVLEPGATLVTGPLDPEIEALAESTSIRLGCRRISVPVPEDGGFPRGPYRRLAFALAETAVGTLFGDSPGEVLEKVSREAVVPGRLEVIESEPEIVFDVAHNPDGHRVLAVAMTEVAGGRPIVAVFGALSDKDHHSMLGELGAMTREVVFCKPRPDGGDASGRQAADPEALVETAREFGIAGRVVRDPVEAVALARALASERGGVVLVCGTHRLRSALHD